MNHVKCNRCNHDWEPKFTLIPKRCPNCNSPYWNKTRVYLPEAEQTKKSVCLKCSYIWHTKILTRPVACPGCGSRYWDKERRKRLTGHQVFIIGQYKKVKEILKLMNDYNGDIQLVSAHFNNLNPKCIMKRLKHWNKMRTMFEQIPSEASGGLPSQIVGGDDL